MPLPIDAAAPETTASPLGAALRVVRPGRTGYAAALDLQHRAADALRDGTGPETLFLLEHSRVVTLGRRARTDANLRLTREALAARGVEVVETDRGGDVTYHGPGQLVGYPILDLRRRGLGARSHLHQMEECLIRALAQFGVTGFRDPDYVGVWTDAGKIAAMGIRVSAGITTHGFALNVNTDLDDFGLIVPCGITNRPVASLSRIVAREVPLADVMDSVEAQFRAAPFEAEEDRP